LLKNCSCKHNDTSCSITDFVILRSRKLNQKLGGLMMNLHFFQNSCAIIGDDDFSVW
jgi:hypothetical protein